MRNRLMFPRRGVRIRNFSFSLAIAILFAWQFGAPPVVSAAVVDSQSEDFITEVIQLTNNERSQAGLPPLTANPLLTMSAQGHADDMAVGDFFDHVNPTTGSEPKDRITAAGYQWSAIAENIAAGQDTPEEVVEGWMNSPGHRANILSSEFTEIGVGYSEAAEGEFDTYWVQNFGSPLPGAGSANSTPTAVTPSSQLVSDGLTSMTVNADPVEANINDPISVSITLTGDNAACGQSIVVKPLDVILVLDRSGSMAGEPLIQAREAAKAFVDEMDLRVDRVGIVQFDDFAQLVHGLGGNSEDIKAAIDGIVEAGGTSIHEGLRVAFETLSENARAEALQVIVLLSDGQSDPNSANFVAQSTKGAGIKIVTVGLGQADPNLLREIASIDSDGHANYHQSTDPSSLKEIYVSIAQEIREYGLAKDLTLRFHLNLYDFALIPESLEGDAEVAGDTITWRRDVLENGSTSFDFQVWGRNPGTFDIGGLTEAGFLECEQTSRSLQTPAGPSMSLKDLPPAECTDSCPWWVTLPWWIIVTLLFVGLLVFLLLRTSLGGFLRKTKQQEEMSNNSTLCKLSWVGFYTNLSILVALISYTLLSSLCGADQVYFWKVMQDGNVGIFSTRVGARSSTPVSHLNAGSNCVACHNLGNQSESPLISAVENDQNGNILIRTLDGMDTSLSQLNGSYMAWSPNGSQVAISLNDEDIQILDIASGNLTPLAGASDPNVIETMPAWSPSGDVIAFVRATSVVDGSTAALNGPADIYIVPAIGGVSLPLSGASGDGFNYYPAYSPDGEWLAFTRHVDGQDSYGDNAADVYLIPATGGSRILLRANNDQWSDTWPTWSNDGQLLGFSSNRINDQYDVLLTGIGSDGQSSEACLLPGAATATDEEFHPVWVKTTDLPWWERLLALWPWFIPLPILLAIAIWACKPRKKTIIFVEGTTGKPMAETKFNAKGK